MKAQGLSHPEEVVCVGGGSKNPLVVQILADLFKARVSLPSAGAEAAAVGAGMQAAAVGSGADDIAAFVAVRGMPMCEGAGAEPDLDPERQAQYDAAKQTHTLIVEKLFG